MIFALGFLTAGLLTLVFLPAIWRRAQRLSQRRLEQRLPVSMAEIAAERDQLRAEFAVEQRRIEQNNESLVQARARDLSELGRRGVRIAELSAEVGELGGRVRTLEEALGEAERRAGAAEGLLFALEKEVLDSATLAQRRMEDSVALQRGILAASDLAEGRRAQIAGLQMQVESLEAQMEDVRRELGHAQLQLSEKTSAAELFSKERDFARSDAAAASLRRDALQKEVEELNALIAEKEQEMRLAQRVRARMANEIADQARALEAAKAVEEDVRAQSSAALDRQRDEARRSAERAQQLRAERDSLQGALDAARLEAQHLREEIAMARADEGGGPARERDDAVLRQAITEVGAEVLRLAAALERDAEDKATPAERVQRLQKKAGRASSVA